MSHIAFFQNGREGKRPLSETVIVGGNTWEVGLNSNEDQVNIRYRPDEEKRATLVSRHRSLTEEKHGVELDRRVRVEKGRMDTETLQGRKDRAEARFKEINRELHRIEAELKMSTVEDIEVFNLRELKDTRLWAIVGLEASDVKATKPDAPAPVIEDDAPQGSEPSEPEANPLDELLAVIDQTVLDVTRRDFILAEGETPEEIWKPLLEAKDLNFLEGTNVRDVLGTVSEDKFADVARHFKKLIEAEKARPKDETEEVSKTGEKVLVDWIVLAQQTPEDIAKFADMIFGLELDGAKTAKALVAQIRKSIKGGAKSIEGVAVADLEGLTVPKLEALAKKAGIDLVGREKKADLIEALTEAAK